jgi:hypothetical protein
VTDSHTESIVDVRDPGTVALPIFIDRARAHLNIKAKAEHIDLQEHTSDPLLSLIVFKLVADPAEVDTAVASQFTFTNR